MGCTFIDKLADSPDEKTNDRNVPTLKVVSALDGVRVIRLTFRDGEVLADHAAPKPILVMGQKGTLDFEVEDGEETKQFTLGPGTAVHVDAKQTHRLAATDGPATATLLILR